MESNKNKQTMEQQTAAQSSIKPQPPKGLLWKTIPMSPVKIGILAFVIFYVVTSVCYAISAEHAFHLNMVIFGLIVMLLPVAFIFVLVMLVFDWIASVLYKSMFHTPMPKKTYIIKYIPIILLTLFIIASTVTGFITSPASSLRAAIMQGSPLPQSITDLNLLYRSGLPFDGICDTWTFNIAPQDFDKLLGAHKYERTVKPEGFGLFEIKGASLVFPEKKSQFPAATMTQCYSFPVKDKSNDPETIHTYIYTNDARDTVIVTRFQY